jgi:hypothetical protein
MELYIDSTSIMNVIKNGVTSSSMGYSLVKSIRKLLDEEWEVKISHSYREANQCTYGCFGKYRLHVK